MIEALSRTVAVFAAIAIALAPAASEAKPTPNAKSSPDAELGDVTRRAESLLGKLEYERAREILEAAVRDPLSRKARPASKARLWALLGRARAELGDSSGADEAFLRAVAFDRGVRLASSTSPKILQALERARANAPRPGEGGKSERAGDEAPGRRAPRSRDPSAGGEATSTKPEASAGADAAESASPGAGSAEAPKTSAFKAPNPAAGSAAAKDAPKGSAPAGSPGADAKAAPPRGSDAKPAAAPAPPVPPRPADPKAAAPPPASAPAPAATLEPSRAASAARIEARGAAARERDGARERQPQEPAAPEPPARGSTPHLTHRIQGELVPGGVVTLIVEQEGLTKGTRLELHLRRAQSAGFKQEPLEVSGAIATRTLILDRPRIEFFVRAVRGRNVVAELGSPSDPLALSTMAPPLSMADAWSAEARRPPALAVATSTLTRTSSLGAALLPPPGASTRASRTAGGDSEDTLMWMGIIGGSVLVVGAAVVVVVLMTRSKGCDAREGFGCTEIEIMPLATF